jgi:hypothetical protein
MLDNFAAASKSGLFESGAFEQYSNCPKSLSPWEKVDGCSGVRTDLPVRWQARSVAAAGESSDSAAVCRHAVEDRNAAVTGGMRGPAERNRFQFNDNAGAQGKVSAQSIGKNGIIGPLGARQTRTFPCRVPLELRGPKPAKTLQRASVWSNNPSRNWRGTIRNPSLTLSAESEIPSFNRISVKSRATIIARIPSV